MRTFLQNIMLIGAILLLPLSLRAQQVANSNFEDWSGTAFDGEPQPKGWNASHVEQVGLKFNFAHKETGHNGGYCLMVQDQDVGAMGITETSPGYFSLGQPWAYLPSITAINQATAGTYGGIDFKYRPDSMSVWIKRTGSNWEKEDFYLLYYAWTGVAKGEKYKAKNGSCTSYSLTDEESDVRQALNGNECGTAQKVTQVSEGMWRERATYANWINIKVPILYFNNTAPTRMNIIFSASNYPNFRANSGLYTGNSLYVDDVELIYSSKIQKLIVDEIEWRGFDPNTEEVQYYALGESATAVPDIVAMRGAGSITNAHGTTVNFPGRQLSGSEITVTKGDLSSQPTTIVVKSEDGKSTTTYRIQFQKAASSNAKLAGLTYTYTDKDGVEHTESVPSFSPSNYDYTVGLPYGTTKAPKIDVVTQEDGQKVALTQATAVNGTATAVVTAANGTTKATYTVQFSVAQLSDNTLKDIQVNGKSILGFSPLQTVYKVSLPVGTNKMTVKAVSAYKDGEQTITYSPSATLEGTAIDGATVQISVTTPGNPVAKVYKLNIKCEASSYSYLSDLKVEGDQIKDVNPSKVDQPQVIDFQPDYLTYYINLKMGSTSLPKITAVKGDEYQKEPEISSLGAGVVDGTVRITVTAGNGDQTVYKLIFATEKSEISTLAGIKIGGKDLEGFKPEVTTYTYTLPVGTTTLPEIQPVAGDEFQNIEVTTGGVNGKTRIAVTAQNGSTTIYQITFSVATYSVNTLAGLYLDGKLIDGFVPTTDEYWVNLPKGTTESTLPKVTFKLQDENFQKASDPKWTTQNGDYIWRVTVRPQNGESRTYTIHFTIAKATNTALSMIYIDGVKLSGFKAETLDYTYKLPEGVSTIPTVTFDKAEESQRVTSVLDKTVQHITVTAESGAKREYTVTFVVTASQNSKLSMIYLDGKKLAGFKADQLNYEVQLNGEKCPTITVDKAPGQQVTITAPYSTGEARITVQPEQGTASVYIINFVSVVPESAQLAAILIDGKLLAGFNPSKLSYTAEYERTWPKVGYTPRYEGQHVDLLWKGNVAWLYVLDSLNNKNGYNVTFTRKLSSVDTLSAILINNTKMPEFKAQTLTYNRTLPAGSTYPTVSYLKGEDTQNVFFGQVADGKWQIVVEAENGKQKTYMVNITILPYSDATLKSLSVEGFDIAFEPNKTVYELNLEKGLELPDVSYETREEQVVLNYNRNDTTFIHVTAQSGDQTVYTVCYKRTASSTTALKDILIDGQSIKGFSPDKTEYTYELVGGVKVIPDVFPVAMRPNQTILTELSRPRSTTKITVTSEGGEQRVYSIFFPVRETELTSLGSLTINGIEQAVDEETHGVEQTEYSFNVPYGTSEPYEVSYTAHPEAHGAQLIEFVSAPITDVTKIIVTNSLGMSRTYSIRYNVGEPVGANKLNWIAYAYTIGGSTVKDTIKTPVVGDNKVSLPFGTTAFSVTGAGKNYEGQSVFRFDGSIRRSAKLIVAPNRVGEEDVTYTVTPEMPEFDTTGKLETLLFRGAPLPNWHSNIYSYVVSVDEEPRYDDEQKDFSFSAYDGKAVEVSELDLVKKQITFTVEGGATYSVCWYYPQYGNPFDFSGEWEEAANNGYKPSKAWTVPGDLVGDHQWGVSFFTFNYKSGNEVLRNGNGVLLQTVHGASLAGSIPGMMTTGEMSITLRNGMQGGSSSSITETAGKGIDFRNTPDSLAFYRAEVAKDGVEGWSVRLSMSDGEHLASPATVSGTYAQLGNSNPIYEHVAIPYPAKAVKRFTATFNAAHTENANELMKGLGGVLYTSALQLQDIHFVYNSDLTAIYVNGNPATDEGNNTFSCTISDDYVGVPSLTFDQKVHDQMQVIEWLNDGEWLNGELTAKVTNFGENLEDKTEYTVIIRRNSVNDLNFNVKFASGKVVAGTGDTTYIELPYGTTVLPDMTIQAKSAHQRFQVEKNGKIVKVTVQAEDESKVTKVYVYREKKDNTATLNALIPSTGNLNPAFGANTFSYTIKAAEMPEFTYERAWPTQTVDLKYGYDVTNILVIAENGTKKTYTIKRLEPGTVTSGKIASFKIDDAELDNFGGDKLTLTHVRPDYIWFERQDQTDSVAFTITPLKMTWEVYNSEDKKANTYVLTYPTASANTALATILLNGETFSAFEQGIYTYEIETDSTVYFEAVPAEEGQKIRTVQSMDGDVVVYAITVTAQDGKTKKTYTLRVSKPKSTNAELSGILIDGVLIDGFRPDSLDYTIVIPSVGAKQAEPKMPSVSYLLGEEGQTVNVTTGKLNDKATLLTVHAASGPNTASYEVMISSEPSHCTELSGIILNGAAIENFEPGRHFYSVSLHDSKFTFDYTTDDRFQTVTTGQKELKAEREFEYNFHVVAQDGSSSDYLVQIYVENPSSDCQLANITLDGEEIADFQRALNVDAPLKFDPALTVYDIKVPSSMKVLPEVSAQLKMEGQTVSIEQKNNSILLHVTAPDGKAKATYHLNFHTYYSQNAQLKMIYLNGEALSEFKADKYVYIVQLKEGVRDYPDVSWLAGENTQTVSINWDKKNDQAQITVKAEDETVVNTYNIIFQFTRSAADQLLAIYADGELLKGFKSDKLNYTDSLAVGTQSFPTLSWETADEWQTVKLDIVSQSPDGSQLTRSITVTAENGKSKTYFVTFVIRKSAVNTLQMLIVDKAQLAGFSPTQTEYSFTLTAARAAELNGQLPEVDYIEGDEYQTVFVSQAPDALGTKSLGFKSLVTVTAQDGSSRIYTIHYPVEMSTDATLNMIMLGGKPLPNFDSERFSYTKIEINRDAAIPVVSVIKKEDVQTYEIRVDADTVKVQVWAEDLSVTNTYTLVFERLLSANALLKDIILRDAQGIAFTTAQFPFRYDVFEYTGIILPFDPDHTMKEVLPSVEVVKAEVEQTWDSAHYQLADGDVRVDINVTAANGVDQAVYTLIFHWNKPSDAFLASLLVNGTQIEGFNPYLTEYDFLHPYGTPAEEYFSAEDVTYVLSDPRATAEVKESNGSIIITVTAQDGVTKKTYVITQTTGKDSNNDLKYIIVGNDTLDNFKPAVTEYTYWVANNVPTVDAVTASPNATYSVTQAQMVGDTCTIIVVAQNGDRKYYYIYFKEGFNDGLEPTANDVLIKRVLGAYEIFVATIRRGVRFALFDQNGRLVYSTENNVEKDIPVADPNYVNIYHDAMDKEVLSDVLSYGAGLRIPVIQGQIYFYSFYSANGGKIIKSGKLIAL